MDADGKAKVIEMYKQLVLGEVGGGGVCEACGASIPHRSMMTNTNNVSYIFNGQIGSPGHPALPVLQCPVADNGEHWACSPDCWEKLAVDCIQNHQKPILVAFHEQLKPA